MFVQLLESLRPIRGMPIWVRYVITAGLVFACFGIRVALEGVDEASHLPLYLVFVPAVIIAAFLFNRGSGFFAVALSGLVGLYFFTEPRGSLALHHTGEAIRLIAFLLIGFLSAALVEALRKTVDELAEITRQMTQRTAELTATRAELIEVNRHRELLLADINHRIKNHLASVAAGLSLSRASVQDEAARSALQDAIARLDVLGRVYTRLHIDGPEVTLDSKDFLDGLCSELSVSLIGSRPIAVVPAVESHRLTAQQAVNLGLIVNELVNNSVKHAFPDDQAGEVQVRYGEQGDGCKLEVLDSGVGALPAREHVGAGVKLVKALVGQMGGTIEWTHGPGTRVTVSLPTCAPAAH